MAAKKTYPVTLTVPKAVLKKLPAFNKPKLSLNFKRGTLSTVSSSKVSSPTPDNTPNHPVSNHMANNAKINSGVKEMSTAGLTLNNVGNGYNNLDKSGNPTKKWHKKTRLFKTFSGFKATYMSYAPMTPSEIARKSGKKKEPKEVKTEKAVAA